jgi:AraC-like DNA-binding protein
LQVKLATRGTSFLGLVNDTRQALACGYLQGSVTPITEIAFLLGFSDTSNFSRAFRRWTGESPSRYRAHNAQRPPSRGTVVRRADFPERSRG